MKLSEFPMPASSRTRAAVYVSFGTKNGPPLELAVRAVSVRVRVAAGFWADAAEAMKKRATHARSRRSNMKASKSGSDATGCASWRPGFGRIGRGNGSRGGRGEAE